MIASARHLIYVIFSVVIIIVSLCLSILNARVKVTSLKIGEPLTLIIDDPLPAGKYFLDYYIACSGSNSLSPMLEFVLKTSNINGTDTLFDKQTYSRAVGFGSSCFEIKNTDDIITAEFRKIEVCDKSITSAVVGNVYIRSIDGSYQKSIYTPGGIGKQSLLSEHVVTEGNDISLSDFATLKDYTLVEKALELKILCTKDTTVKYELGLIISSDNINALLPDGNYYGLYPITPSTDSWVAGEEYVQHINLDLIPGHYDLGFVLLEISPDTPYYFNRYTLMDNKHKTNIVCINSPGQSLSEFLRSVSDGQIVIISVMDEATNALNEMSLHSLSELGLESDLIGKIRWSYIGIAAKGVNEFESLERLENAQIELSLPQGTLFGGFSLPFDLSVVSAGFDVGNMSSIIINETEYSQAKRGMNIVVYDTNKNDVVSSVNFDTYLTNYN